MIRLAAFLLIWASAALAQDRVEITQTEVAESGDRLTIMLGLSDITPYRAFTLEEPYRVVLDVEGIAFDGLAAPVLEAADQIGDLRTGPFRPGWGRIIFALNEPMNVETVGLVRTTDGGVLTLELRAVGAASFAEAAGAPPDPGWDEATGFDPQVRTDQQDFVVVIDAAHGGELDEGYTVDGLAEADLSLILAQELAVRLAGIEGLQVDLTRDADRFVPIASRLQFAATQEADLLVSLHAYESAPDERGAFVWTFADEGDAALTSQLMDGDLDPEAARGVAPSGVAAVLADLARAETLPASERIADGFAASLARSGVAVREPARGAGPWPILSADQFPSVVISLGNLANAEDRAFLASPEGRNAISEVIAETLILLAR